MSEIVSSMVGVFQFSSGPYLVLLALAVIVYFLLPGPRTRAIWLLALSGVFYVTMSPRSSVVLLLVSALSYAVGLLLDRTEREDVRKGVLIGALVVLVGGLAAFKYLGLMSRVDSALNALGPYAYLPTMKLLLPLGVSFWTFQTIAYVVDIYKRKTEAERNPLYFLLAVSFFPIVTSGPITRVQDLVSQLKVKHRFDYDAMQSGLLLIARGFFKKLMIADRLAIFVNTVFAKPGSYTPQYNSTVLLVAAVFFAIQLYCDFSGYTDIVRGSARLFGVELPINFRNPYFARSVRDFWRRWHITLMDWFRDYIYIPLGGNRVGKVRRYVNLLAVFAISGLWHGEGFTYLVWGLLNGFYQIAGQLLAPVNQKVAGFLKVDRDTFGHHVFQTVVTFALVTVAWVFFRANTLGEAVYVATRMWVPTPWVFTDGTLLRQGLGSAEMLVALLSITVLFVSEYLSQRVDLLITLRQQPLAYRWAFYYALILAIVIFGAYGGTYNAADFVYFKY